MVEERVIFSRASTNNGVKPQLEKPKKRGVTDERNLEKKNIRTTNAATHKEAFQSVKDGQGPKGVSKTRHVSPAELEDSLISFDSVRMNDTMVDESSFVKDDKSITDDSISFTPMTARSGASIFMTNKLTPNYDSLHINILGSPNDDEVSIDNRALDESFDRRRDRNGILERALLEKAIAYKQGLPLPKKPAKQHRRNNSNHFSEASLSYSESDKNSLSYSQSTNRESAGGLFESDEALASSQPSHQISSPLSETSKNDSEQQSDNFKRESLRGIYINASLSSMSDIMDNDEEKQDQSGEIGSNATTERFQNKSGESLRPTKSERFKSDLEVPREVGEGGAEEDTVSASSHSFEKPQSTSIEEMEEGVVATTRKINQSLNAQVDNQRSQKRCMITFRGFPIVAQISLMIAFLSFVVALVFVFLTVKNKQAFFFKNN